MSSQARFTHNQPDILFITPPVWDVHLPFAAVPQLMGACKNAGISCMQLDFGIMAFRIWFEQHYKEKAEKYLSREYYDERVSVWKDSPVSTFEEYIERVSFLGDEDFTIDKAKAIYKTGGVLEKGIIQALSGDILKIYTERGKRSILDVADFFVEGDSGVILECIKRENLTSLFQSDIKLVGISVTGTLQLGYTKELIETVKELNPSAKIVLGGSAITLAVKSDASNTEALLKYADYIIIDEGESSIIQLAKMMLGEPIDISKIPGLIYNTSTGIQSNPSVLENIESVPKPCFDGIDFNLYMLPDSMFPYHTSRGCYYGNCAFCNHDHVYRHNFRQKSVHKVISEILELVQQTGVRHIQFTDEAIEPRFFSEMVRAMDAAPEFNDISWFCYLRVSPLYDEETVRLAAKNGCRMVMIGVESFQQRILNFIKKGHKAATARENLRLFHKHGIKTFAWFMYGLPSETVDEAINDAEIIIEESENIGGFANGAFMVVPDSDLFKAPEKYNILEYNPDSGRLMSSHYNDNTIDTQCVRDAYNSKLLPFKRKHYFSSNRYVILSQDISTN